MKKGTIIGIIIAILVVGAIGFFGIVALIAMPNLTKVQDRTQVNADIRTAEQISRAITIWSMEEANREIPTIPTKYDKLEKIEDGKWDISGYGGYPGMYADIIVTYQAINHDYSIEDTVNSDNTITKAIYIEESKIDKMPTSISFKNETDLLTVDKLRIDNITDTSYMFNGCSNLTSVCALDWDTSKITKADYMFAGCSKLIKESFVRVENGNTKQFELPNVKSAICIFDGCINLK